jgi:transposase-like protein
MIPRAACPQYGSTWFKRNGHSHTGKQNHRCKLCGRAFVLEPENSEITEEQRTLLEHLLLERISLRGICRAVGVGLRWLLQFMVERFQGKRSLIGVIDVANQDQNGAGCEPSAVSTGAAFLPSRSISAG